MPVFVEDVMLKELHLHYLFIGLFQAGPVWESHISFEKLSTFCTYWGHF
jgi:hypothetical protein